MTPFFLLKAMSSAKKEAGVVLVTMAAIIILPIAAVSTTTNLPALAADTTLKLFTGAASVTNTYEYGYCTFWSAKRREEIGKPIPSNWGDAHTWDDGAKKAGYLVDHTPSVGAVMEIDTPPLGHVAFVEKVNPDGSWEISEMNVKGWDILSSRTFSATAAQNYNFIH